MSEAQRQTRIVYNAFCEVVATGRVRIRPGDIVDHLRRQNQPLGIWYVNGEFTRLASLGLIKLDEESAQWQLVPNLDFDEVVEKINGEWDAL